MMQFIAQKGFVKEGKRQSYPKNVFPTIQTMLTSHFLEMKTGYGDNSVKFLEEKCNNVAAYLPNLKRNFEREKKGAPQCAPKDTERFM